LIKFDFNIDLTHVELDQQCVVTLRKGGCSNFEQNLNKTLLLMAPNLLPYSVCKVS